MNKSFNMSTVFIASIVVLLIINIIVCRIMYTRISNLEIESANTQYQMVLSADIQDVKSSLTTISDGINQLKESIVDVETSLATISGGANQLNEGAQDVEALATILDDINQLKKNLDDYARLSEDIFNKQTAMDVVDVIEDKTPLGKAELKPVQETTSADSTPTPTPEPASNKASAGDKVTVHISSTNVSDMYGYELKVHYNKKVLKYNSGLKSGISEISTIFGKEFEGHILIGSTKIGDQPGFNGDDVNICELSFVASQDCDLDDIFISDINIVTSKLENIKDIKNWSFEVSVGK